MFPQRVLGESISPNEASGTLGKWLATFLLKNCILKKACHRASFSGNGHNGFFEKSYHKKAPHRPTKNDNQTKAFCVQKFVRLKSPVLARLSDGSGTAQFALKHRGEVLSPQARKTFLRAPLLAWKSTPHLLCGTTKEYRRYSHLYSRIIPYPFRSVNKIQTFVRILLTEI